MHVMLNSQTTHVLCVLLIHIPDLHSERQLDVYLSDKPNDINVIAC